MTDWQNSEQSLSEAESSVFGETIQFRASGNVSATSKTAICDEGPAQETEGDDGRGITRVLRVEFEKSVLATCGLGDVVIRNGEEWDYGEKQWEDSSSYEATFTRRESIDKTRSNRDVGRRS